MSVLALIPARSGSKGIPGKNFRTLGGQTLVWHAVTCAFQAAGAWLNPPSYSYLVVSSDVPNTEPLHGVNWLMRPPELAQDDTPMLAVVQHALAAISGPEDQIIVLLQPTQPFRTPAHVQQAITLLRETQADSVVSVVELPKTHNPEMVLGIHGWELYPLHERVSWVNVPTRRQDVQPAYRRDGTVYAFWRKTVTEHGTLYGQDVRPLIIPAEESCELDTEADWQAVQERWLRTHLTSGLEPTSCPHCHNLTWTAEDK